LIHRASGVGSFAGNGENAPVRSRPQLGALRLAFSGFSQSRAGESRSNAI
jgi:hypothetical protein